MTQEGLTSTGVISIRGLCKRYGSTRALDGLNLDLRPGEVLGVAGPNGAGKSTLMRILAGEERADSGAMTVDGTPWTETGAVAVVHQEPQLFPNLTVAENLLVGREGERMMRPRTGGADRALMAALGIDAVAGRALGDCTLATQQRTEIARALARDSRLFLFDEPNSALTDEESDELFHEMRALAAAGRIVILVTHRLSDLARNAARVAIVRDGRVSQVLEGEALSEEAIAQRLVLVDKAEREASHAPPAGRVGPVLRLRGWSHARRSFSDISLEASGGEIVALMGVEGSGGRELLRSLGGLERCAGSIAIADMQGGAAIVRLAAYVPATRQESLYSNLSVGDNLIARLGRPDIAGPGGMLKRRRMRALARDAVTRFFVKTGSIEQPIRSLSGGNQQKVAIAQALVARPRLLLLEEPTRGVDIGSRREIYRLLRAYASGGNVVVMFCTEVLEMYEAADLVFVISDGRLSRPLPVADFEHVEALVAEVTRLERHGRQAA